MGGLTRSVPRLVFLGAPGVGKGTFSGRLSKKFEIPHISTGDIIRAEIKAGSKYGKEFKSYTSKGLLVPDQLVVDMAVNRIQANDCRNGYILDGFPRTIPQATELETYKKISPNLCVNIILPQHILTKKLLGRRMCDKCGGNYNVTSIDEKVDGLHIAMAPLLPAREHLESCSSECPLKGAPIINGHAASDFVAKSLTVREDDNEVVIKDRMKIYSEETAPIEKFYEDLSKLCKFTVLSGIEDLPALEAMIRCKLW